MTDVSIPTITGDLKWEEEEEQEEVDEADATLRAWGGKALERGVAWVA